MLPQEPKHLFAFVRDARIETRIGDVIGSDAISKYDVFTLVETAFKGQSHRTFFLAASDKILFFIFEQIEQHPRDRLDDRRLTRAVLARYGGRSAVEFECGIGVRLDVLKLD